MRTAFWILTLFALAVAITLIARLDQGYVIVVFPPWRLEMSFLLTVALLAGGFVLASFLLHLARTALRLPEDLRAWRQNRHQTAADHALLDALRAHFAGDERKLRKALKKARDCHAQDLLEKLQLPQSIEDKPKTAEIPGQGITPPPG
ncbi:MAG: heme biosynthesis protein HemY [Thiobacillus sp.]|nr:heme biosynthesis protein HemY [Thiobacillus sp.]